MFCALDKEGQKIEAQSTSLSSIAKALLQDFCHDLNYSSLARKIVTEMPAVERL
jgi:hypothetical protein